MGCGGSKQKAHIRSLKLENVGVSSVDRFNNQVEEVIEKFAAIYDDIERKKATLLSLTAFDYVNYPESDKNIKNITVAMLLQFFAVANGDLSKIKIDVVDRKPFLKISLQGLSVDKAEDMIKAQEAYIEAIADGFEEKLPRVISEMGELEGKAADLQANAAGEFEALDEFNKMRSIAKTVKLVSELPKIPAFMKQTIKDLEEELKNLKELTNSLKNPQAIADNGKKCAEAKVFTPARACYYHIYPQGK